MEHPYNPNWNRVVRSGKYLEVYCPTHPNKNSLGYVAVHRIVAEIKIRRLLTKDEVIHHINEDKHDNRPENLQIMTAAEHARHHHPGPKPLIELVCPNCGVTFYRRRGNTKAVKGSKHTFCSRRCNGLFGRSGEKEVRSAEGSEG